MVRPLFLLGASGHAKMVIEAARSQGEFEPLVCLAGSPVAEQHVLGVPVELESPSALANLLHEGMWAFVAIGENGLRRKLQCKLEALGFPIATIVANGAWLSPSAQIGPGSVLMPNSTVGAQARIGHGVIVNTNASADHDCVLGSYSHIAPGTHLAGNVTIEEEAFCGVGASIVPHQRVGARATVGAGAVVVRDIPSDEVWVGCPARPMHSLRRAA